MFTSSNFGGQQPQQQASNPFGTKPSAPFGSALNISTTAQSQPSAFSWGAAPSAPQQNPLGTSSLFATQKPGTPVQTQPGSSNLGFSTLQTSSNTPVQQQQQQSALPVLNGAAKFNDLPTPIQDLLNDTESLIQGGLNAAKDLKGRKLGESIVTNTANSRQLFHDLTSGSNTLQADDLFAKNLRTKVDQAVQDVIICSRIIEGFKESGIQHPNLKTNAQYPLEFFDRLAEQMQERLIRYKSIVDQLNRKLAYSFQAQQTPQAITTTLQSQHASFIALAAKVAEVEASLDDVKQQFAGLYKARTGSALDPFGRVPS